MIFDQWCPLMFSYHSIIRLRTSLSLAWPIRASIGSTKSLVQDIIVLSFLATFQMLQKLYRTWYRMGKTFHIISSGFISQQTGRFQASTQVPTSIIFHMDSIFNRAICLNRGEKSVRITSSVAIFLIARFLFCCKLPEIVCSTFKILKRTTGSWEIHCKCPGNVFLVQLHQ